MMRVKKISCVKFVFNFIVSVLIVFVLTTFCVNSLYSSEKSARLSVDSLIIGRKDTIELTVSSESNILYINDSSISNYFNLVGPKRYGRDKSGNMLIFYSLSPKSVGSFEIGNFMIHPEKGKPFYTETITISVVEGSIYADRIESNGDSDDGNSYLPIDKRTFVTIETDKKSYYRGESIVLSTYVYSIYPIGSDYEYYEKKPILTDDFWEHGFHEYNLIISNTIKENIDEVEYDKKLVDKRIIFPKFTGSYTFGPYSWKVPFGERILDFDRYLLKTNKVNIHVRPLPDNKQYKDYRGGVGSYDLTNEITGFSSLDENGTPVFTGETFVRLIVKVKGRGNPDLTPDPDFSINEDEFELISEDITPREKFTDNGYDIVKIYEYLLRPCSDGIKEISPVKLFFFNPDKGVYEQIFTESKKLCISDTFINNDHTDSKVESPKQDISEMLLPQMDTKELISYKPYLIYSRFKLYLLAWFGLLIIFILISFMIRSRRKYKEKNQDEIKKNKACRKALSILRKIEKDNSETNIRTRYKRVYQTMLDYINERFKYSSSYITNDGIREILIKNGFSQDSVKNIVSEYENISHKIYSGSDKCDSQTLKMDIKSVKDTVNKIEEIKSEKTNQ